MLLHCLHMEMEQPSSAYHCVESEYYVQSIADLAKSSHQPPKSVIGAFFAKIGNTVNVRREFEVCSLQSHWKLATYLSSLGWIHITSRKSTY